jgi:hypothetical protein
MYVFMHVYMYPCMYVWMHACMDVGLLLFFQNKENRLKLKVVLWVSPFVARQRLGKHIPTATNTCKNGRIVERVCLWVCLCIPLPLLGNNSVYTFPGQRRIFGGVVFYAVLVVSKESNRLVLPRTSCNYNSFSAFLFYSFSSHDQTTLNTCPLTLSINHGFRILL